MKRFVVGVISGFTLHDGEVRYDYEDHYFDSFKEARMFARQFPKGQTYLMDLARLPF